MSRWIQVGDFRIGDSARRRVGNILDSGRLSEGRYVREFEDRFASWAGARYCAAMSSGTSALLGLFLALRALGDIGRRSSKIYIPAVTYIADANAVVVAGLEPVFVDLEPGGLGMNPAALEEASPEAGSAILPVHLFGYPADILKLKAVADIRGAVLLEDCAQAHGTITHGHKVGSFGRAAAYSFYCAHTFAAGELGCVTTDDRQLVRTLRQVKANGRLCSCDRCRRKEGRCPELTETTDPRFTHPIVGLNLKGTEMAAAVALSQLEDADAIISARQRNVQMLSEKLAPFRDFLRLPLPAAGVSHLAYPIVVRPDQCPVSAGTLRQLLEERGVETRPIFPCIPLRQPAYAHLRDIYQGKLPQAEAVSENGLYVGCHQFLKEEDIDYIATAFGEVLG